MYRKRTYFQTATYSFEPDVALITVEKHEFICSLYYG